MLAWYAPSFGQEVSTTIQVKKAGLISKDRFLTITLSDAQGNVVGLTDETLAAAPKRSCAAWAYCGRRSERA